MSALMKTQTTGALTEICLTVPSRDADRLCKAIHTLLELAKLSPRPVNEDGEELYTGDEVFPEGHPGMALRGLRTREGITQKELAARLGIRQHHVSEMEKGIRPITLDMAKRIGEAYKISYKVFV
jgi:DNA-binding XRE family transcriptional regulator